MCDELIVVDTGSVDDSPAIARSFGASVVHTRWIDDFSAARNVYLEHARCPWVLSLDADETLDEVDKDDFIRALDGHPATAFLFRIRNYFADGEVPEPALPSTVHRESHRGPSYLVTRTVRLFPRVRGMRYCFPVHESLLPAVRRAGVRVKSCGIPIRHVGYARGRTDSQAKAAMYRCLGEKKIAEFPSYYPGYVELGKVYLQGGDLSGAERMFVQAIRLAARCVEAHYFLASTLVRQERYMECDQLLRSARRRFPGNSDIAHIVDRLRVPWPSRSSR